MFDGVDVSWPQGSYRPGKESFVFVGASSADGGGLFVQNTYALQVDNARRAGKEVGHYFFNGNINPVTAANYFVDHLHDYRRGDGIALDIESSQGGYRGAESWGWAEKWVDRVADRLNIPTGSIGIYCNRSDNSRPGAEGLVKRGCWLWIAWPGDEQYITTGAWPTWAMWQHGIIGVDRNVSKFTLAQLSATAHIAGTHSTPLTSKEIDLMTSSGLTYKSEKKSTVWWQEKPNMPFVGLDAPTYQSWVANGGQRGEDLPDDVMNALLKKWGTIDRPIGTGASGVHYRQTSNGSVFWQKEPHTPLVGLTPIEWAAAKQAGAYFVECTDAEITALRATAK